MKLSLWRLVLSLRDDIGRILERTLMPNAPAMNERTVLSFIDSGSIMQLRIELRNRLDLLKDALHKEVTENEAYLVMFPLVLLCDEMVMSRLPKQQHTEWRLLQQELFQINYGGDVFYDFVDERLAKPDTPAMVFEVLFFCLSAGFVGKFGIDGGKVVRYKGLLTERIPGALSGARKKKRRREREEPPPAAAPVVETAEPAAAAPPKKTSPAWYYGAALATLMLAAFAVLLFTNL
jgi:type VI secretion system protein ImpK